MPILQIQGGQAFSFGNREDARIIQLSLDDAVTLFSKYSIKRPTLRENLFGLFSFLNIGRNLKARYMSMGTPKHVLSKRKNGCQWNPKGRVTTNLDEFSTGALEYNGEECPDAFYDDCMERIFGTGNDIKDMLATPEGAAILEEFFKKIYTAIHNSIYDLIRWANHPLITQSDTNGWWEGKVTADEWKDFKDQQLHPEVGGHMTTLDSLATVDGLDHLNVPLQNGWVNGKEFVGDVIALFKSLVKAAPHAFEVWMDDNIAQLPPVMEVTKGIFNAYYDHLTATYSGIPEGYLLKVQGTDGRGLNQPVRNALLWNGIPIVKATAAESFYSTVGVIEHRAVLIAPGNYGVAIRNEDVVRSQDSGVGLMFEQSLRQKDFGKMYMSTNFRLGSAIMDSDFVTMAKHTAEAA